MVLEFEMPVYDRQARKMRTLDPLRRAVILMLIRNAVKEKRKDLRFRPFRQAVFTPVSPSA
jgi:hypothetical protein